MTYVDVVSYVTCYCSIEQRNDFFDAVGISCAHKALLPSQMPPDKRDSYSVLQLLTGIFESLFPAIRHR